MHVSFGLLFSLASLHFVAGAQFKRSKCANQTRTAVKPDCCAFYDLADDLQTNLFQGACARNAQLLIRLSFHDAIGFSKSGKFKGHGADGSMLIFGEQETTYPANAGIDAAVTTLLPFLSSHPSISAGDLIQFAAAVALTNCPGAPRIPFLAGRPNAIIPADNGTVPEPQDSVDDIFKRMQDAGLTVDDTVNLLASHSVSHAPDIDPTLRAPGLDSTSATFDSQFYLETLMKGIDFPGTDNNTGEVTSPLPSDNVLRLQSDYAIARDSRSACLWKMMINNQGPMTTAFAASMLKMSMIGQNPGHLFDCTEAVPHALAANFAHSAQYPAGKSKADVDSACKAIPLPHLATESSST